MTSPSPATDDDDDVVLFEKQKRIYPRAVTGVFRRRKWWLMAFCLALYYFAPFLRWDRGEHAPDQAILIDMVNRRAYWFFIEIWPQEAYYLVGILIVAAILLFFVTSLLGRVWCGYFCFQTVWTDLFILVERLVQGDSVARRKLDAQPWGWEKIRKKGLTHLGWLLIGLVTGGAFVLYFNDAPTLIAGLMRGEVSPTVATFVLGLTFSTYLMAGFAREQVCTFMCPYARFQSAMFDKDSLIIAYDHRRGEPRGKHKKGDVWAPGQGHCVDCTQCVQVCPMGIDIRNGLQIECIACGLCIDACDSVMDKVGLPRGLIRYDTERNLAQPVPPGTCTAPGRMRLFRPRTIWYVFLLAAVGGVTLFSLLNRSLLDLHVLHDRNPLFVRLSDGAIRNGYEVHILNKTLEPQTYRLSVDGLAGAQVSLGGVAGGADLDRLPVAANEVGTFRLFITAPRQDTSRAPLQLSVAQTDGESVATYDTMFISPEGATP